MTKTERNHLERIAAMGCIVCHRQGHYNAPAEVHHIRAGQGMGQRASHFLAIPLCPEHHRTGGHGTAIHAGLKSWEMAHGSELELLAETYRLLSEVIDERGTPGIAAAVRRKV